MQVENHRFESNRTGKDNPHIKLGWPRRNHWLYPPKCMLLRFTNETPAQS